MNESLELPRQIRKFNPGAFQPDEEVIHQFVARKPKLGIVMNILRGNVDSPSCQHVLVVAPRGRGKTMLLARVAADIRSDREFSERLLPIRFMEESQEIFNLTDFWLESLFYLAKESKKCDPELALELQDTHDDLATEWRGEDLEERARATVLEAADRLGRRLVLMVENLQALCEHVDDDFGWKLRGALQSEPQIILLATATSRFKGLDDAREPFFELFRIVRLDPLNTEECRCLWQMVSGDTVSEREVRPLQILTGGNPRLLVIIGEFARHRSLRQLMEELVKLIDDHTEYFRGHLEVFAKTERRVYLAVIDLWQPSTTGEIAARARMDVRAVSALLGRLVERGAVLVEGSGRKRTYVAAERLYSIYYKLRRERDEAAVVRNLIHFMAAFYTETELDEWSRSLTLEAMQWPAIREGIKLAIAESARIGRIFPGEAWQDTEQASDQAAGTVREWAKLLRSEIRAANDGGDFEKLIEIADRIIASRPAGSSRSQEQLVALTLGTKGAAHANLGNVRAAMTAWDEAITRFGDRDTPEFQLPVAHAMVNRGIVHAQLGDPDAGIADCDEVVGRHGANELPEFQWPVAKALSSKGMIRERSGEFEAAIAIYEEVDTRFRTSDQPEVQALVADALSSKTDILALMSKHEATIATCDDLIKRFGGSESPSFRSPIARALVNKAQARGQLGENEAAIATCDEVLERFRSSDTTEFDLPIAQALVCKGASWAGLGNIQAAISAWDEVVARFGASDAPEVQLPVAIALGIKGLTQGQLGDTEGMVAARDEGRARFDAIKWPESPPPLPIVMLLAVSEGEMQAEAGDAEGALRTCDEIERDLDAMTDNERIMFQWRARRIRTKAMLALGQPAAAMDAFRSAYAAFDPADETMMREMLATVPDWVAAGASERDLVEVLSSDREKAGMLQPLVVALRQRTGEAVRAPGEVLEVAADIRKQIETKVGTVDTTTLVTPSEPLANQP